MWMYAGELGWAGWDTITDLRCGDQHSSNQFSMFVGWLLACLLACLTSQQQASASQGQTAQTILCAATLR